MFVLIAVSHMELAELSLFAGSAKQMNLLLDLSGLGLLRMPPMDILQRLGTVLNRDYAGADLFVWTRALSTQFLASIKFVRNTAILLPRFQHLTLTYGHSSRSWRCCLRSQCTCDAVNRCICCERSYLEAIL